MLRGKPANINAAALVFCAVVVLSVTLSSTAFAQTPTPRAADAPQADLSITGRVTARELRFEKVPNPTVEFTGQPRRETVWQAQRENLPEQVQPGVTYRDIGITLRITSVFADIDRIVAEALGEIPVSDDAQPPSATPERPATPPTSEQTAVPPAANKTLAAQTNAQPVAASNSFPATPYAMRTTQRTRPARKGRSN